MNNNELINQNNANVEDIPNRKEKIFLHKGLHVKKTVVKRTKEKKKNQKTQ